MYRVPYLSLNFTSAENKLAATTGSAAPKPQNPTLFYEKMKWKNVREHFDKYIKMSVYSGFATRQQETFYNKLLQKAFNILSERVLVQY